jgi:hypothetical protein
MTGTSKVKQFNYKLRALPNGKFHFLLVDLDNPNAPKRMLLDITEAEVRDFYRRKWGYSDAEIDERLSAARGQLKTRRA